MAERRRTPTKDDPTLVLVVEDEPKPPKRKEAEEPDEPAYRVPGSERPTEASLASWYRRTWNRFRAVRELDEFRRGRVYRRHVPSHIGPQGEGNELVGVTVRSGTPRTVLREFVGIVTSSPPRVEALAKGVGPTHQKAASHIEDWDEAWKRSVRGDKVIRQVDSDQLLYARGVHLVVWAPQYWANLPKQTKDEDDDTYLKRVKLAKRDAPTPIVWLHRPAPQCLWSEDDLTQVGMGPARACHWELKPLSEIADRWPKSKVAKEYDRDQLRPDFDDPNRLYVCWANRKYLVYATAGGILHDPDKGDHVPASLTNNALTEWEILEVFPHNLGKCPFVIQKGPTSSDPELVNAMEGALDNSLELMDLKDDALTQFATLFRRYARSMGIIEQDHAPAGSPSPASNPGTNDPPVFTWNPDTVPTLPVGAHFRWLQPDLQSLAAAQQYIGLLDAHIERDVLAPSSYGRGAAGSSGFELVTRIQNGERRLAPLMDEKQEALESVYDIAHRWVAQIGHEDGVLVKAAVTEEGSGGAAAGEYTREDFLALTPSEAKNASISVHVEARLDSADAASMQILLQLSQGVAQGWVDIDPAYLLQRFGHIDNPTKHQDAADLWRFLKAPEVVKWRMEKILAAADILEQRKTDKLIEQFLALSPEEQAKVPPIILSLLAEQGIQPALPPGEPPMMGEGGPPGGMTPQLAGLLGGSAPPGVPAPNVAATAPGSPRAPGLGAPVNQMPDVTNVGLSGGFISRAGQPRSAAEAGNL